MESSLLRLVVRPRDRYPRQPRPVYPSPDWWGV